MDTGKKLGMKMTMVIASSDGEFTPEALRATTSGSYLGALIVEAGWAKPAAIEARLERIRAGMEALFGNRAVSQAAFFDAELAKWVGDTLVKHPIDTIFVFSGQMGQYIPSDFAGRVVVDLCDVDSEKFATYAQESGFPHSVLYRREATL
ncbi:MAG: hypothetical protein ABGZ37_03475, partial [Akkermansiaceae bacterium]